MPKTSNEKEHMDKLSYAFTMGSLMYVMLFIRPDICYAVGIVSRYQSNPGPYHRVPVNHILKYLRRMRDYMLVYSRTWCLLGTQILIFNQIRIQRNRLPDKFVLWAVVPLCGEVSRKFVLLNQQWRLNMQVTASEASKEAVCSSSSLLLLRLS